MGILCPSYNPGPGASFTLFLAVAVLLILCWKIVRQKTVERMLHTTFMSQFRSSRHIYLSVILGEIAAGSVVFPLVGN